VRILKWAGVSYVVWLAVLMLYAAVTLPKTEALPPNPIGDTGGAVWLLVGSDSREGLTPAQQRELRTGGELGERTDTIMLVHMGLTDGPTLVSVPRDSWVTIPEHTTSSGQVVPARPGKINSAYAFGGPQLLTRTIEQNTGLHVDHYMEIGLGGIVTLTDAVGGIDVCFDKPINDEKSGLDVPAGCQTLDGRDSLAWVRMRYSDPKGDLGRVERQQQYVASVADKLLSWQTLVSPIRQWRLVKAVNGSVEVDQDAGIFSLGRFGIGMGRIATGGGEVTTVPVSDSDHWEAGQWVLKWDQSEANQLFASLGGTTPPVQAGAG